MTSSNKKRGEEALNHLEREIKARDRKEKARPFGVVIASVLAILVIGGGITTSQPKAARKTSLPKKLKKTTLLPKSRQKSH